MASEETPVSGRPQRFAMNCPRCLTTLHVRKHRLNHIRYVVSIAVPHTKVWIARHLGRRCTLAWKRVGQVMRRRRTSLVPPGFIIVTPPRRASGLNAVSSSQDSELVGISCAVHAEMLDEQTGNVGPLSALLCC